MSPGLTGGVVGEMRAAPNRGLGSPRCFRQPRRATHGLTSAGAGSPGSRSTTWTPRSCTLSVGGSSCRHGCVVCSPAARPLAVRPSAPARRCGWRAPRSPPRPMKRHASGRRSGAHRQGRTRPSQRPVGCANAVRYGRRARRLHGILSAVRPAGCKGACARGDVLARASLPSCSLC